LVVIGSLLKLHYRKSNFVLQNIEGALWSLFKGLQSSLSLISAADDKEGNLALSTSIFDKGQQFSKK
jgi:hypothetical protein